MLQVLSTAAAGEDPRVTPLTPSLATAVVGGLDELLTEAVEDGREERIGELAAAATELIRAVATRTS
jgi:hypothetical protein